MVRPSGERGRRLGPVQHPGPRPAAARGALVALVAVVGVLMAPSPSGAATTPPATTPPSAVAPWPQLPSGYSYGIDVSSYQGNVNWPAVAAQGVSFAYVKATEGTTYVNPYFTSDWAGASAAHLALGAYHFFSLCADGKAQARAFLAALPKDQQMLPPALDIEMEGSCARNVPAKKVAANVTAFTRAVESATGYPVLYYVAEDFALRYHLSSLQGCPLWLQSDARPAWAGVVVWQPSQPVSAPGVAGQVDLDMAVVKELQGLPTHRTCHLLAAR